jgi:Arc/MetJ family transcription regulator
MGRTNVELDDRLVGRVMKRYRLPSKRAAIDFALRRLDLEPLSRDEALAMRGSGWDGDLEQMRGGYLQNPPESSTAP